MTPLGDDGPYVPAEPRPVESMGRGRLLLPAFVTLVLGVLGILYAYGSGIEAEVAETLVRSDLEQKATAFSEEARRLLEGSNLADYFERNQPGFERFEELLRSVGDAGDTAFLHLRDGEEETLLFRGPDLVQKLTVGPEGVEIMEGDGATIRQMIVQRGEGPPEVVPVERPVAEALDAELMEGAFRSPERRFEKRILETRRRLRRTRYLYTALGVLLVAAVFALLRRQMRRIRHLEEQVRRQRHLAYLGTLAGGLAHEIRNPLNGIALNMHLLEESLDGADETLKALSGRFLGRIRPALGHLERIVSEFLDFARPRPMEFEAVDLAALVEEVREFLEPHAGSVGVALEVETDPALPGYRVRGDRERLREVLLNLVRNAFEALEPLGGGRVRVLLGPGASGGLRLVVEDDGPGVPSAERGRLFRLFYTTREGGTGLGLPIVRRVIEDHGGRVTFEPGAEEGPRPGARFVLQLPEAPARA